MTRLLFKRYLITVEPVAVLVPLIAIGMGVAVWVLAGRLGGEAPGSPVPATRAEATAADAAAADATAADAAAADAAPEPAPPLRLTFLGDIMAHRVNFAMEDFDRIYADIREELRADDLTFANLETPVVPSHPYETYPRFNVKPPYLRAAVEAGIEVFSAANNHASDRGVDGVHATRRAFASVDAGEAVYANGLRESEGSTFRATSMAVRGTRIGFLAVAQVLNDPEAGDELVHLVDYREREAADRLVRWVADHAANYDVFVLSYHGGREYALEPDPRKTRFFERLVRAGVDVVWSHHPHVVQPWRHLERADGSRALVLHSTGNLISGQTWGLGPEDARSARAHTGDSALFRVKVSFDGGSPRVSHEPILITNYLDPEHGMVVRRLDGLIAEDIGPQWKLYYVVRRNALREIVWRSTAVRVAVLD